MLFTDFQQKFIFYSECWVGSSVHYRKSDNLLIISKGAINSFKEISAGQNVSTNRSAQGVNISRCLKPVKIMLETLNLVRKYKDIYSLRKYTFQYQEPFIFADVSIMLQKTTFFGKTNTFIQSNSMTALWRFFRSAFSFRNIKDYY